MFHRPHVSSLWMLAAFEPAFITTSWLALCFSQTVFTYREHLFLTVPHIYCRGCQQLNCVKAHIACREQGYALWVTVHNKLPQLFLFWIYTAITGHCGAVIGPTINAPPSICVKNYFQIWTEGNGKNVHFYFQPSILVFCGCGDVCA